MQKLNFDSYKKSLEDGSIITAKCDGVDIFRQGENSAEIPVFRFEAGKFSFYMPFSLYNNDPSFQEVSQSSIYRTMSTYVGKDIDFIVLNINEDLHMGIVSHVAALEKSSITGSDSNEINLDETVFSGKVTQVTRPYIHFETAGFLVTLRAENLPDVRFKDLTKVFKVGDVLNCSIQKINPIEPLDKNNIKVTLLDYPKISKDFKILQPGSYYAAEVMNIRKNNSGVSLDCFGNSVFCQYPISFIPIEKMGAVVKIIKKREDKPNAYIGKLVFCEMPIGSY